MEWPDSWRVELELMGLCSYALTPITAANLSNVDVLFQGNLHLPQNISYVQGIGELPLHHLTLPASC